MRPYDSTSILEICSVWWYRITGKNEPNPEHIVFRQNFLKRPCVHKLSMDSQHPCQCEWTNMSASTKPSQWRAFTIFDTKAYKKKAWTKPHKWDMTSIRMKVNFVSVCSQWSSTKKRERQSRYHMELS